MKVPKYILRIGFQEFVIPDDAGLQTLRRIMEDAVPVNADLEAKTIELLYTEDEDRYASMLEYIREVRIKKIPAGTKWKRKTKLGKVEEVQVVTKKIAPPKPLALKGPKRPALPPRSPQLTLL